MRLNKQFYLPILITLLTVTGPVQAVTAAEVMTADDVKTDTKLRLPNDGRSDLQELIQRVASGDTGDGQPTEPEPDEIETPEIAEPEQPKVEADPQVEQPTVAKVASKQVSSAKAPRGITTNTNGTSTWTFDSDTGLLVFGAGQLAQRIDTNIKAAGLVETQVKSIQFESNVIAPVSVTYLFANLGQLSEFIDLQNFDTSNVTSMSYWFYNSKGLTNPDLSVLNTSNVTDMSNMFYGTLATSLDLSAWNVDKVTTFAYMFSGATALTTLNLSSWGSGRSKSGFVVTMTYMFYNTSSLSSLDLTGFETTNVNNMFQTFYNTGLTNLDLSDWDVTKVTTFANMFYGTKNLKYLDLSNWGVDRAAASVTMSGMFSNATALTNLNLTNFKTTNVTSMDSMFRSTVLTNLDLSDWDVTQVTTFANMFYSASKLTTLNLSGWGVDRKSTTVNVSMSYMFSTTTALNTLELNDFRTTNVTNMSYMFDRSGISILDLSIWDVTQVTTFANMFNVANKLSLLDLTNWGVDRTADSVTMNGMFNGTTSLNNLTLTNFQTKNVVNMSYMFYNSGIYELDLSEWDVSKVTTFVNMFYTTKNLTTLNLSNWGANRTAVDVEMNSMFYNTTGLSNLILTNFQTTNVINMNSMFYGTNLAYLNLSSWDVTQVTSFTAMFYDATKLTHLDLSNWGVDRTAAMVNMDYMFYNTGSLITLTLTNFKTTNAINMASMFRKTGLTQLDLSEWDVSKVTVFAYMFTDATKLVTLDLSGWRHNDSSTSTYMTSMFQATFALKSLILTDFTTTNVTNMPNMFNSTGLESLDLHTWDVSKVGSFQSMFEYSSLKEVNLSGWRQQDSPVETNFNMMFAHMLSLKSVIFTDFNTENVQSVSSMFVGSSIETLDLSSWDFRNLGSVMDMLRNTKKLWRITLGENCQFLGTPTFTTAPQVGTTVTDNGQTYKTTTASWQEVGAGTAHNPKGAFITTDEMWSDTATRPVTYVWAQAPTFDGVANLTFGTLGAGDFRNGNKLLATNMATGSVNLINLESGIPYKVSVAQTSDWQDNDQSATISKNDLSIQYGQSSLNSSVDFWTGTSANSQSNIMFNHNTSNLFSICLNPNTVIDTELLGKQLESELTWTLSETP